MNKTSSFVPDGRTPQRDADVADGRQTLAIEIEDDLFRAAVLNDLACWVGKAKHLIDALVREVYGDDSLKDRLVGRGVGVFDAEWHDEHAEGLAMLHLTVNEHLREVRRVAGIDGNTDGAAPAPGTSEGPRNAH